MKNLAKSSVMLFLGIILLSLMVPGCASVEKKPDSLIGSHQSDLIASWGTPTRTNPDGKGGSILTYEEYFHVAEIPGRVEAIGGTDVVRTKPKEIGYIKSTIFHVNEKGYIYRWEQQQKQR